MSQLAQILVRSVVRAFYDVEHVVVIDALAIHSAYVLFTFDLDGHPKLLYNWFKCKSSPSIVLISKAGRL